MGDNFKKELARDFLALGSWVFFLLVIGRILVLPYRWPYLDNIIGIGVFILILEFTFKSKIDYYVSRAVVLAYFTTIFYENYNYSIFVILAFVGLFFSSWYIGKDWRKSVYGLLLGIILIGLSLLI